MSKLASKGVGGKKTLMEKDHDRNIGVTILFFDSSWFKIEKVIISKGAIFAIQA